MLHINPCLLCFNNMSSCIFIHKIEWLLWLQKHIKLPEHKHIMSHTDTLLTFYVLFLFYWMITKNIFLISIFLNTRHLINETSFMNNLVTFIPIIWSLSYCVMRYSLRLVIQILYQSTISMMIMSVWFCLVCKLSQSLLRRK